MTTTNNVATIPTSSLSTSDKVNAIIAKRANKKMSDSKALAELNAIEGADFENVHDAILHYTTTPNETPQTLPIVENSDIQLDAPKFEPTNNETPETSNDAQSDDEKNAFANKREFCLGEIKKAKTNEERKAIARKFSPLYASHVQVKGSAKLGEMCRELNALGFTEKDILGFQVEGTKEGKILNAADIQCHVRQYKKNSTSEGTPKTPKIVVPIIQDSAFFKAQIETKYAKIETLMREMQSDKISHDACLIFEKNAAKESAKNTLSVQIAKFKALGMSIEDILAIVNA